MTWICVLGTELSARLQNVLILAQTRRAARLRRGRARPRACPATSPLRRARPELGWLNPFGAGGAALTGGLLLGVFAYWGWESAVNLTEETRDSRRRPRAGRPSSPPSSCWSPTSASRSRSSPSPGRTSCPRTPTRRRRSSRCSSDRGHGWLGLGGAAGRRHLGDRLHADDDHPGVPDRPVDGPPARAAPGGSAHIYPRHRTPDVSTWWVGSHRHRLVRRGQPDQRERAVRLDHRAVAADRLLLRADRHRLRDLLPPRS